MLSQQFAGMQWTVIYAQKRCERCSTQQWGEHSSQMERVAQTSFELSHYHTIRHTGGAVGKGKYHHCSRSLPSCQSTESCRLWWNLPWNAQTLQKRSSLAKSHVKWHGVLEEHRKIGKMGWSFPHTRDRKQCRNFQSISFLRLPRKVPYTQSALKEDAVK